MIQILRETQNNLVATKATGKLTEDDYKKIVPVLEGKLEDHDKIRWYFEMVDLKVGK